MIAGATQECRRASWRPFIPPQDARPEHPL